MKVLSFVAAPPSSLKVSLPMALLRWIVFAATTLRSPLRRTPQAPLSLLHSGGQGVSTFILLLSTIVLFWIVLSLAPVATWAPATLWLRTLNSARPKVAPSANSTPAQEQLSSFRARTVT